MSQSNSSRRTVWLVVIALTLLVAIPFAIHHKPSSAASNKTSPRNLTSASSPTDSDRTIGPRSNRASVKKTPPSHSQEELQHFVLPGIELRNVTLEEAIESLIAHYRQTCREVGESPIDFSYTVKGNSEVISSLNLSGNFLSSCRLIGSLAATALEIEGERLIFKEVENGEVIQRRWTVPPSFLHHLQQIGGADGLDSVKDDPFAEASPLPGPKSLFAMLGIQLDDGSVSHLPGQGTIIVSARMKDLVRIDSLVAHSVTLQPMQSRIRFPHPDGGDLPFDLVLRPGNLGTLQLPSDQEAGTPGAQYLISVAEKGFGREIKAISFPNELPGAGARELYMKTGNLADLGIVENMTSSTYNVNRWSGEDHLILIHRDATGTQHELPFSSERIDATGRALPVPGSESE